VIIAAETSGAPRSSIIGGAARSEPWMLSREDRLDAETSSGSHSDESTR
jgi:hypothetical protein